MCQKYHIRSTWCEIQILFKKKKTEAREMARNRQRGHDRNIFSELCDTRNDFSFFFPKVSRLNVSVQDSVYFEYTLKYYFQ